MREAERNIMLHIIDDQWKDHLLSMDHLKEGIGLRGYGQKDPLVEYKKESFTLFQDMMDRIEDETVRILFTFTFETGRPQLPFNPTDDEYEVEDGDEPTPPPAVNEQERLAAQAAVQDFTRKIERNKDREMAQLQFLGGETSTATATQTVVKGDKVGRNDPCPCGSGKKYKKCHGA
jgi:preprotein translocase subunit SecA